MAYCAIKSKLSGKVISIEPEPDPDALGISFLQVVDQHGPYVDNELWEFVPYAPCPGYHFIKEAQRIRHHRHGHDDLGITARRATPGE